MRAQDAFDEELELELDDDRLRGLLSAADGLTGGGDHEVRTEGSASASERRHMRYNYFRVRRP